VRDGIEPKPVSDDYDVVRKVYSRPEDTEIDLSGDNLIPDLCSTALSAAAERLRFDKIEKAAKAEIIQKLGNNQRGTCGSYTIKRSFIEKSAYLVNAHTETRLYIKERK